MTSSTSILIKHHNTLFTHTDTDRVAQTEAVREPQRENTTRELESSFDWQTKVPLPVLPALCLRHASLLHPLLPPSCLKAGSVLEEAWLSQWNKFTNNTFHDFDFNNKIKLNLAWYPCLITWNTGYGSFQFDLKQQALKKSWTLPLRLDVHFMISWTPQSLTYPAKHSRSTVGGLTESYLHQPHLPVVTSSANIAGFKGFIDLKHWFEICEYVVEVTLEYGIWNINLHGMACIEIRSQPLVIRLVRVGTLKTIQYDFSVWKFLAYIIL